MQLQEAKAEDLHHGSDLQQLRATHFPRYWIYPLTIIISMLLLVHAYVHETNRHALLSPPSSEMSRQSCSLKLELSYSHEAVHPVLTVDLVDVVCSPSKASGNVHVPAVAMSTNSLCTVQYTAFPHRLYLQGCNLPQQYWCVSAEEKSQHLSK